MVGVPAAPVGRGLLSGVGAEAAASGGPEGGVPICVATSGASAPRLEAVSGIASPVVPTGTTRLRPRPGRKLDLPSGGRGRRHVRVLLAPAELRAVGPDTVQGGRELRGDRHPGPRPPA